MEYKAWVVVANNSRARIFGTNARGGKLTTLDELDHPEARLRDSEMRTDKPGRMYSMQGEFRSAAEHTPARKHEAERFAHKLADHLDKNLYNQNFEKLVLVASPGFLGTLRQKLSDRLRKALASEMDKDLSHLDKAEEVRKRLPEYMW